MGRELKEREIAKRRGERERDSYERLKICLHLQKLLECTVMKNPELRCVMLRGKFSSTFTFQKRKTCIR